MAIFHARPDFDFSKVHLATPTATASGSYFTKINHTPADNSLYMYTPKIGSKAAVVASGTKKYMDLVLTNANTNFIEWAQELEATVQHLIYEKRNTWFTEDLERDDIETCFVPILKAVKGGKYTLRAYVQQNKSAPLPLVFDDKEMPRTVDHISPSSELIAILDFQGVKFTSKSFAIVVVIKQIMVMETTNLTNPTFNQCLIKPSSISKIVEVLNEDIIIEE